MYKLLSTKHANECAEKKELSTPKENRREIGYQTSGRNRDIWLLFGFHSMLLCDSHNNNKMVL